MTDLIRWTDNGYGGYLGYVGTLDDWMYQIWKPDDNGGEWVLQASAMAGRPGRPSFGGSPDELKPRAEELLREFAASLGAVFPEPDYHGHYVNFSDTAFWTEHPRGSACNGDSECPVHAAARKLSADDPAFRGRWLVLSHDGPVLEEAPSQGDDQ